MIPPKQTGTCHGSRKGPSPVEGGGPCIIDGGDGRQALPWSVHMQVHVLQFNCD